MKIYIIFFIALLTTLFIVSCTSPGEKAAKESMDCMEKAINNSNDLEEARMAIQKCQENMREKYSDKLNDPDFIADIEKTAKGFDSKMEEILKKKFGNMEDESFNSSEEGSDFGEEETYNDYEDNDYSEENNTSSDCDQFIKDYEEFANNYIRIIKKYKQNPTDMSILSDYQDMMEKATEMQNSASNCTDPKYVTKLTEIANKIAKAAF